MNPRARLLRLAERRTRLTEQAGFERESLAALVARTDSASDLAAGLFATGQSLINQLRRQPLIAAAMVALLFVLKPRRALGWVMKAWSLWRLYRGAMVWLHRFAASGDAPARR